MYVCTCAHQIVVGNILVGRACMRACACVDACVHVRMCVCVHVCMRARIRWGLKHTREDQRVGMGWKRTCKTHTHLQEPHRHTHTGCGEQARRPSQSPCETKPSACRRSQLAIARAHLITRLPGRTLLCPPEARFLKVRNLGTSLRLRHTGQMQQQHRPHYEWSQHRLRAPWIAQSRRKTAGAPTSTPSEITTSISKLF